MIGQEMAIHGTLKPTRRQLEIRRKGRICDENRRAKKNTMAEGRHGGQEKVQRGIGVLSKHNKNAVGTLSAAQEWSQKFRTMLEEGGTVVSCRPKGDQVKFCLSPLTWPARSIRGEKEN